MKIIGHRGAAGLATENTLRGIKAALDAGVDGIEVDVRVSTDGHLVLSHDASLERVFGISTKVSQLSMQELSQIKSADDDHVPTLVEAMKLIGDTPIIIEGKSGSWPKPLARLLQDHPKKKQCSVISFNHQALAQFGALVPDIPLYVLEHRNSFDAINAARIYDFAGVDINYLSLNPLAYWLAKRHNLSIVVFTVNRPWIARLLNVLYPRISITTNVPDKVQFLRKSKRRRRHERSL